MNTPTISDIQTLVADRYGVSVLDLCSRRRMRKIVRPRQVAIWLCRHVTPCSLPEIGRAFGNRDHTTVMHAIRVVDLHIRANSAFVGAVPGLLDALAYTNLEDAA